MYLDKNIDPEQIAVLPYLSFDEFYQKYAPDLPVRSVIDMLLEINFIKMDRTIPGKPKLRLTSN